MNRGKTRIYDSLVSSYSFRPLNDKRCSHFKFELCSEFSHGEKVCHHTRAFTGRRRAGEERIVQANLRRFKAQRRKSGSAGMQVQRYESIRCALAHEHPGHLHVVSEGTFNRLRNHCLQDAARRSEIMRTTNPEAEASAVSPARGR